MTLENDDTIVCKDCNFTTKIADVIVKDSINRCPNCNSNLGTSGKAFSKPISENSKNEQSVEKRNTKSDRKSAYHSVTRLTQNKIFSTTIIGSLGLLFVSLAFIQIISSLELSFPLYFVTIIGVVIFLLLTIISFYFSFKRQMDEFSIFLILMLGEIFLVSTLYFVDISQSSSFNRHGILSTTLVFAVLILSSTFLIKNPQYEAIHRVIIIYLSWLVILYVAGHEYISKFTLTAIVVVMIISIHFSIMKSPIFSVVLSALALEFLILIQTRLINNVSYVWVAFVSVISFPIIGILLDLKGLRTETDSYINKLDYFYYLPRNNFYSLIQIPQIAIAIGIVSGGTVSPFSEFLIGVYCISWVGYLQFQKNYLKQEISFFKNQSFVISVIMMISISIFSLDNDGLSVIPLFTAIIILVVFLLENLEQINQKQVQIFGVVSSGIVTINLVLSNFMGSTIGLGFFLLTSLTYFWKEIRRKIIKDYMYYSISITGALMMSFIFVSSPLTISITTMITYSIGIILFSLTYFKFHKPESLFSDLLEDDLSYITLSFSIVLPFNIFFTDLSDESYKYWIFLVACVVITSVLFIKRTEIQAKMMVLSLLLLVLPLIYSLTIYSNEIYSTSITFFILIFAIITHKTVESMEEDQSQIMVESFIHVFFALAILSKLVILDSSEIVIGDLHFSDLILLGSYFLWIFYILYNSYNLKIENLIELRSLVIGFIMSYVVYLQIVLTIRNDSSDILMRIVYFLNQLLILGIIGILSIRNTRIIKNEDFIHLGQSILIAIEIFTFITSNFIEIQVYHSILLVLLLFEFTREPQITKKWIALTWLVLVESGIILISNYNVVTIQIMFFLLFGSLKFQYKPRKIIDSLLNITANPVRFLIYETVVMLFIYLLTVIYSYTFLNFFASYSIYWILTVAYFIYNNAKETDSFSTLIILNLFVIMQIYWTNEFLNENIKIHFIYFLSFLITLSFGIYSTRNLLFKHRRDKMRLYFDIPAIGISPMLILSFTQLSLVFVYDYQINSQIFNQIMGFGMLIIVGIFSALEKKINSTNFSDGIVISAFLTGLALALFGFFDSYVSNVLISLMVLIFIIIYLLSESIDVLNIGLALFVLSLLKMIIDLLILDTLERGISLLVVGINGIILALMFQSGKHKIIQKVQN
ncbi:MAG: hypothetical protein GPJ54_18785 [Candidatus Heimdallarchaeota archaeon]|nr:hypothetical protein [Candidatus Heimdallarchaeota archaeon]